jgi:hypothetical protein
MEVVKIKQQIIESVANHPEGLTCEQLYSTIVMDVLSPRDTMKRYVKELTDEGILRREQEKYDNGWFNRGKNRVVRYRYFTVANTENERIASCLISSNVR